MWSVLKKCDGQNMAPKKGEFLPTVSHCIFEKRLAHLYMCDVITNLSPSLFSLTQYPSRPLLVLFLRVHICERQIGCRRHPISQSFALWGLVGWLEIGRWVGHLAQAVTTPKHSTLESSLFLIFCVALESRVSHTHRLELTTYPPQGNLGKPGVKSRN